MTSTTTQHTKVGNANISRRELPKIKPTFTHEWPFFEPYKKTPSYWKTRSKAIIYSVGVIGKFILSAFNRPKIYNKGTLIESIYNRPKGRGLITVSNHESCVDDPFLIGMFMTHKQLLDREKMRWTLAAHDICFTKAWHSFIFANGKGIPVVRGLGVYQKAVDFSIERLNEGDWLHIFPEGKVNLEREELYRIKWGIGRIISEVKKTPIVLPFWHTGMADVWPNKRPYYPRINKHVVLNVGHPIDLRRILALCNHCSPLEKRKIITDKIQAEMELLRKHTKQLVEREKLTN